VSIGRGGDFALYLQIYVKLCRKSHDIGLYVSVENEREVMEGGMREVLYCAVRVRERIGLHIQFFLGWIARFRTAVVAC
jgi:hypothetical protein